MLKKTFDLVMGERLAYIDNLQEGKKVLLLIHGNMSSSLFFEKTIRAMSKGFRIIAPDLPGFGDSSHNRNYTSLCAYKDLILSFLVRKKED